MRKIFGGGFCLVFVGLLFGACDAGEPPVTGAGVNDDRVGEVCESTKECAEEEFCATPDGECRTLGSCEPRPTECERAEPVCGCDGFTYGNACEAYMSGMSVDFYGACPPPGCYSNAECGGGEYCSKTTGACNDLGECKIRPLQCSAANVPVCGCNGVTYGNACKAAKAGVTISKSGAC